ncbi:hypothetical protein BU15DRAFT_69476 [Melanogaster broomeanus]|nr:hypothetical protein BU15DRAFT_69476 [Melanogaster broomeanus]
MTRLVATATVISYDYSFLCVSSRLPQRVCSGSEQIEYVWVRYFALSVAMVQSFGAAIYLFMIWGYIIFQFVTDLMLILRVYAMYNRSRIVLGILLSIYIPAMIILVITTALLDNPKTHLSVTDVEVIKHEFMRRFP